MRFPSIGLHVAVAKPTVKTSGWRAPFLGLDVWRLASLLRGSQVLLALDVRAPRAGDKVLVAGGAEYVYVGVFEFGGMSPAPKMGSVRGKVLTD